MTTYFEIKKYLEENKQPGDSTKGEYIGLRELAMGFCVYRISPNDYEKVRIENKLRRAGLVKNEKSMDVNVSCVYDDSRIEIMRYSPKVKDLSGVVWYFVNKDSVQKNNFLKRLIEKQEIQPKEFDKKYSTTSVLGIDDTEIYDMYSNAEEESKPHEFEIENIFDEEEFE